MSEVVKLHRTAPQVDIVKGLRNLADKIEAGDIGDLPAVTTVVCVLGHTKDELLPDDSISRELWWDRYAWGPRADAFTVRGLLSTVINA